MVRQRGAVGAEIFVLASNSRSTIQFQFYRVEKSSTRSLNILFIYLFIFNTHMRRESRNLVNRRLSFGYFHEPGRIVYFELGRSDVSFGRLPVSLRHYVYNKNRIIKMLRYINSQIYIHIYIYIYTRTESKNQSSLSPRCF